jgi:hypothetical protein
MLTGFKIYFQGIKDNPEMFFVSEEVRIARINKKCFNVMLPDIAGIGFLKVEQVIIRDGLFIRTVSFLDIFLQLMNGCVQVDEQVGLNQLLVDDIKKFLIEMKLFIRQIYFGKQKAFGKYIIRNRNALEKVLGVNQFFHLFLALGHKKKLQRKCVLLWILIEFGQKGIFGKCLQD